MVGGGLGRCCPVLGGEGTRGGMFGRRRSGKGGGGRWGGIVACGCVGTGALVWFDLGRGEG